MASKFQRAIQLIDEENNSDPTIEVFDGKEYPKELLYALRMTERLEKFDADSSEAVRLAVRCQHICRWKIPRDSYEMNRNGYFLWRRNLYKFHAKKATEILQKVGYDKSIIEDVKFLLHKKMLKKNSSSQLLEDVACLVFLEFYFEKFSDKYKEDKLIDIVKKTWAKMSDKGHKAGLKLPFTDKSLSIIAKAING